jgi:hypothetical protein
MKFKLYRINEQGLEEFLLMKSYPYIQFEQYSPVARFYPRENSSVHECCGVFHVPAGMFATLETE